MVDAMDSPGYGLGMADDELVKQGLGCAEAGFMAVQRAHAGIKQAILLTQDPAMERLLVTAQMELVIATEELQHSHDALVKALPAEPAPNRAQRRAAARKPKTKPPARPARKRTPEPVS
jgi:hypothetical protein